MTTEQIISRLLSLLPNEGKKSKRAFALFCAERVAHLNPGPRVADCLTVVRQKVEDPESVTRAELTRARRAASAAALDAQVTDIDVYGVSHVASYVADAAYFAATTHAIDGDHVAAEAAAFAAAVAVDYATADTRESERKAQLKYLLSLAMIQFYPGYWVNLEMFGETGEIFANDFVSIRKITDENVLVALDYYLEKREALPLDYFKGLGCWCGGRE